MEDTKNQAIVFTLGTRKPGTTFEQYKSYYENKHAPLVEGLLFKDGRGPLSYTRNYIERDESNKAPSFPFGGASAWAYDCIARVVFRDTAHRDAFFADFAKHHDVIAEDEEKFLDRSKLTVIFVTESQSTFSE